MSISDHDLEALGMQRCRVCDLQGILRLRMNGTGEETLAYCLCDWASQRFMPAMCWALPEVNRNIKGGFDIEPCPREWFMPKNKRGSVPRGMLTATITPIVERWVKRVRDAEAFWRENALVFEAQVRGA